MLTKYLEAAMRRAHYEIIPDDGTKLTVKKEVAA
jgi:hypothetical protein